MAIMREEPLARRLAARVSQIAERRARRERRACARASISNGAVIGVAEHDVALGDAEAIADAVELCARVERGARASARYAADRRVDHREQDEALRAAERSSSALQRCARLEEDRARARACSPSR